MPQMTLVENSQEHAKGSSKMPATNFTGDVFINPIHNKDGVLIADVNFMPGARTNWHHHEGGQILRVIAGSGWVCDKGGEPKRLKVGDVCVCPPDTTHWHGADDNSYMCHQVVAHGKTTWYEEVTKEEYGQKK